MQDDPRYIIARCNPLCQGWPEYAVLDTATARWVFCIRSRYADRVQAKADALNQHYEHFRAMAAGIKAELNRQHRREGIVP